MSDLLFALLRNPRWSDWVTLAAGVGCVLVVFLIGTRMSRQRRREHAQMQVAPKERDIFTQGSTRERRVAPRRTGNPISVLVSDAEAQVEPVRAWVVDRSAGGLALELDEEGEVDVGTVLSVRPTNAPETITWVKVQVRNRKKEGRVWKLGCQFVKPPPWDVLMLFG